MKDNENNDETFSDISSELVSNMSVIVNTNQEPVKRESDFDNSKYDGISKHS